VQNRHVGAVGSVGKRRHDARGKLAKLAALSRLASVRGTWSPRTGHQKHTPSTHSQREVMCSSLANQKMLALKSAKRKGRAAHDPICNAAGVADTSLALNGLGKMVVWDSGSASSCEHEYLPIRNSHARDWESCAHVTQLRWGRRPNAQHRITLRSKDQGCSAGAEPPPRRAGPVPGCCTGRVACGRPALSAKCGSRSPPRGSIIQIARQQARRRAVLPNRPA
jgi:hypothetical protein